MLLPINKPTCRLSELADPYYIFKNKGYDVTLASPNGGAVPVDPASLTDDMLTSEAKQFQKDGMGHVMVPVIP